MDNQVEKSGKFNLFDNNECEREDCLHVSFTVLMSEWVICRQLYRDRSCYKGGD